MKSKMRSLLAFLAVLTPLGGSLTGCSQPDDPKPVTAAPPPPPKPEELKVPTKGTSGQQYGAGDRYQKAMEKLHNPGGS
jgi:hypothetical protein